MLFRSGESMVVAFLGGVLGIVLTFPAAHLIETQLSQFFPVFVVSGETIWFDLLAAGAVGVVAALFPIWRGGTIRVADGLRRIG